MRRIGVLMYTSPEVQESQSQITALTQGLHELGWVVDRNLHIETRWSNGDLARLITDAQELVAIGSDVIVAGVGPTTPALQRASRWPISPMIIFIQNNLSPADQPCFQRFKPHCPPIPFTGMNFIGT